MQTASTWLKPKTKLVALTVAFFGAHAWGQSITTSALAQQYACTSCHSENTKSLGPSWASIRQKYGSQDFSYLTKKILNGGMGVWGSLPMPGNSRMSQSDAETLVVAMGFQGGASASNTASGSASQPPQTATQPNVANNQTSPSSSGNITAECDQEQSRIISKATADAKALVATGDLAGMQRIQLVRNIAMRDLYSGGRCSSANNATARREQAQKFINMDQRFCQQWGMGSQCAAPPVLAAAKPSNTTQSNSQSQQSNGSSTNSQDQQNTSSSSSTSAQSQSSGRRSVAGAQQCISVNRAADRWAIMKNNCPYDIEAAWCYAGGDCKNGTWGASNLGTVRAGDTRSASTFTSKSSQLDLHVIACKGANTSPQDVDESHYQCFE